MSIQSLGLRFKFAEGQSIAKPTDVVDSNITAGGLVGDEDVLLKWNPGSVVPPQSWYNFTMYLVLESQAYVMPISDVQFNNLDCLMNQRLSTPQDVREPYYLKETDNQFLVGLFSIPNTTRNDEVHLILETKLYDTVRLSDLRIDYYFQGGPNGIDISAESFQVDCLYIPTAAQVNCSYVILSVSKGTNYEGAYNVLSIEFTEDSGYLLGKKFLEEYPQYLQNSIMLIQQTNEFAYLGALTFGFQISLDDTQLDVTQDFSHGEPWRLDSNSELQKVPSNQIPVFKNDTLVSGVTPMQLLEKELTGRYCFMDVCILEVTYCCVGEDLQSAYIEPLRPIELNESNSLERYFIWVIIIIIVIFFLVLLSAIIKFRTKRKMMGRTQAATRSGTNFMNSGEYELSPRNTEVSAQGLRYFSRMMGFESGTTQSINFIGPREHFSSSVNGDKSVGSLDLNPLKEEGAQEDYPLLLQKRWLTSPLPTSRRHSSHQPSMPDDSAMDPDIQSGHTWNDAYSSDWDAGDVPKIWYERMNMVSDSMQSGGYLNFLPPIVLPSPVTLMTPLPMDVDLDVNFLRDVQPYLGNMLGSGGFGKVYKGNWNGQKVAVKVIDTKGFQQESDAFKALLAEVEMCCKISGQCERVVKILGASLKDKDNMCIIMELVEGGSLADRIYNKSKRKLSYMEILQLANDISCALAFLHPTIIHRDLKPQNVLLDLEGRAKLADFGISRFKEADATHLSVTQANGTPSYMAPEMFNGTKMDEKCDVYSLGVILWECLTRQKPWNEHSRFAQIIMSVAIMGERLKIPPDTPQILKRLIERCWDEDPQRRPSTHETMRSTEVYIQQEFHSLQSRNSMRQRSSTNLFERDRNSVSSGQRENMQDGESWSSKLAVMRSDVKDAVSRFQNSIGHEIDQSGPSVEDIKLIDISNTTNSLTQRVSLPPGFRSMAHYQSRLFKQDSDPMDIVKASPFRQSQYKKEQPTSPKSRQEGIFGRLSTIVSSVSSALSSGASREEGSEGGGRRHRRKNSKEAFPFQRQISKRSNKSNTGDRQNSLNSMRSRELSVYTTANESLGEISQMKSQSTSGDLQQMRSS